MNQSITLNTNELRSLSDALRSKLSPIDIQELALKSMALVQLYPNPDPSNIATLAKQAEADRPEIFAQNSRNLLSANLDPSLVQFIGYLLQCAQKGLWTHDNKIAWVKYLLDNHNHTTLAFNDGIYELCCHLFGQVQGDIYLPFDEQLRHSVALSLCADHIFAEPMSMHFATIINAIVGNITCQTANPVINPSYVNQGKLQTFAKGFVAGAWGMKIDPKSFDSSRFAVGGNTYQNYLIQHLFVQVSDLALVFVPQNALTASVSSEVEFREWVISQKHLKAVVSLPSGLIANTGMACSLMVFDLKNEYDNVRFISLKDTPFVQKNRLVDAKTLADIINGDGFDNAISASHDDIIAQNHVLDPERYVLNNDSKKAMAILENYQTVKLGDIADIIRPTPASRLKGEGDEPMGEIQGGDLPSYGYISEVSKRSFITKKAWQTAKSTQVQDGDIIMTIRGSTGKVGLVGQSLIDSHEMPLVVGQTGIIIRPHGDKVSPTALYMQLHSAFAQNRLALFSVGSAIAGLSVKDIKEFDIAILSQADEQKLIENFQKQCIINDEIIQKQQELARLSDEFWDN